MKKHKVYVGSQFRWDFVSDWQWYVNLAKNFGCRFDATNKCWTIPNFATARDIVRTLLQSKPADEVVVTDFDKFTPVPAGRYILPEYERERTGMGTSLPLGLKLDGKAAYLAMPLDNRGKPALDHAVYYGLASVGCKGAWVKDRGFELQANIPEATEFLAAEGKVPITGVPSLRETPFITSLYDRILPHQEDGVGFLYHRPRALLADDMGLGKTMQAIIAAEALRLEKQTDSLLVICPVSLIGNWRKELKQWETGFSHVSIVPYSQLAKLPKTVKKLCVVVDEAHYLKNPTSQRTKTFTDFVNKNSTGITALWLLTGTPVTKDFSNLWSLAYLMKHPVADKYRPGEMSSMTNREILYLSGAMKTHMLCRKKSEILNLPPKIRGFKEITTGAQNFSSIRQLEMLAYGKDEEAMEHLMTMKRITALAKVEETIDVAQQILNEGRKVVLFSDHTGAVDKFRAAFPGLHVVIDGRTSKAHRTALVEQFQTDAACRVFIGNIKAAGVGITLTASQDVIFNDLTWLPADIHQAEDRCHRIGTTGTVNVTYMADRNLILDEILCTKLAARSAEIATFEQSKQSILQEIREWARAKLQSTRKAVANS